MPDDRPFRAVNPPGEPRAEPPAESTRRRFIAATAAAGGAAVSGGLVAGQPALAAEVVPGSRDSMTVGGSKDHRNAKKEKKMRIVAVEEAFSIPGVIRQEAAIRQRLEATEETKREWFRRLDDVTELRLADMDANGVDMQVLSYSTPGLEVIEDPAEAVAVARQVNDHLAKVVASHPKRFAGFAVLPLQDPKAAVVELRRAVKELGLKGVLYNDHVRGHYLDEPQFRPVWAELERLGVTLYLHPAVIPADNWRVFDGYPLLVGPSWGWTATVGAHALRLIYGGVFDEFPGASVMLGHMGELLPFQMARLDSRYPVQVPVEKRVRHQPSYYLRNNVYATTSGVMSHAALLGAVHAVGVDRVLFSIDYPFESSAEAVAFLRSAPYAPADLASIAHGNAERVLRL
ncbi:amidohydrolase family protein [Streptomyces sp. WI04-05B]|uniref:amidohydrolase family protein n=1 Tax=Streptomyces TaxID=1883 RepID=UPI0029B95987|nr:MULTISPECIES: amidohydrolase family protein [unclassified Streptomyces]MDX2548143.1 amidohydrolase family protein [Streptomyces sp. WI04-05B]MDX2583181.1 amidohydrolase family protein [Streptomyces sp. WI04-05A]